MLINSDKKIYRISAKLIPEDFEIIKAYMIGAVNAVCNTHPEKEFSVRILFGGRNSNWGGTPMQKLYDYHITSGKSHRKAHDCAAKDAGSLLARVLEDDSKKFEVVGKDTGKLYKVVQ